MAKTFKKLVKEHEGFHVPQYEIEIGPPSGSLKILPQKDYPVLSITVNQSVGPASSAQIAFICRYDFKESDFEEDIYDMLKPGKFVEIKLGYKKMKTVFAGILAAINTSFTPSGVIVSVTCYDAKMALFYNRCWRGFKEPKTIKEVIQEVLKPCEQYVDVKVTGLAFDDAIEPGQITAMFQDNIDDYKYIMRLAELTNSSFYTDADKIYFTENLMETADAVVELGWGDGLMSFSVDIDISGQVGSVEIAYRTGARKDEYLTFDGSDIKGKGDLPNEAGDVVEEKSVELTETKVWNEKQAKLLAKSKFLKSVMNYVTGKGSTIGIPEIKAGTAIELDGLGEKLNGKYFLGQVTHQFDAGGYLTNFTCQRAKI